MVKRKDWAGIVAVVLAFLVGAAVLVLAIGSVFKRGVVLDSSEAELLGTVIGAAVGAVATFLGVHASSSNGE